MKKDEKHFEGWVHQNAVVTTPEREEVLIIRDPRDVDRWQLPGGRLNVGEVPVNGLLREIQEELGICPMVAGMFHTSTLLHEQTGRTGFLVMYELIIPSTQVVLSLEVDEVAEVRWVTKDTYRNQQLFADTEESLTVYFNAQRNKSEPIP